MKSENFVVIQGWMCNELELKGNELLIFALIYGFSQDGISRFNGGRSFMADTFNISLPTVDKTLDSLVNKKLIERDLVKTQKGNHYEYRVGKETLPGGVKKLYPEGKETLPNNIVYSITGKDRNNSKELLENFEFGKSKVQKQSLYAKCISDIDSRNYPTELHNVLIEYLQLRLQIKDKPLYANSWKGLLNKLEREFTEEERVGVVLQSIERGYASFFPVSSGYKKSNSQLDKPWEKDVSCKKATKEEEAEHQAWLAKCRAKGIKVDF